MDVTYELNLEPTVDGEEDEQGWTAMVYRMARSGRLPSYRIGRRLRFDLVEVHDALKAANGR